MREPASDVQVSLLGAFVAMMFMADLGGLACVLMLFFPPH
jgi:hypothetical protein